ncbi:hypothetical protein [Kineococcus sp. NPDC059986]|uniref:hypothetical protein n=1 Tax=Kineococcus sp. NPDC059986 TaxID=3155538 RepID=UPI00344F437A
MSPHAVDERWADGEPAPVPFSLGRWAGQVRRGGSLSDLTWDGVPVLKAVRGVVRDRDWRTAPVVVTRIEAGRADLLVTGTADDDGGEDGGREGVHVDLSLHATAAGERLVVEVRATARTGFLRNRLGLVVLHHADDAGRALTVHHPDGTTTRTRFPVDVAPHQPARDVAGLAWSRPGVDVDLRLTGDVFEVEDQRNWTDASFKTYSTPLDVPFPVAVAAGSSVVHRVEVAVRPTGPPPPTVDAATVAWRETTTPWPAWGTDRPVDGFPGTLLVELLLDDPDWRATLDRAVATGLALDVRLVTDDLDALSAAVHRLRGLPTARLGVHSATRHVTTPEAWAVLAAAGLDAVLVAGSRAHFTELNRTVDDLPAAAAGVVFASTPQMHDTWRDQCVDAVPVQRLTARQAVRLAAGRPVHLGPVSVRPRFNAVATTPTRLGRSDPSAPPGPTGPALTAWCVAAAAAFAVDGVVSVIFGDATGPVADAVRLLAPFAGRPRLDPDRDLPRGVHVLAMGTAAAGQALVVNLTDAPRRLVVGELVVEVPAADVVPCAWGCRPSNGGEANLFS